MYHYFDQKKITDFSDDTIEQMYDQGYVFTRLGRGVMRQIKSVRLDLYDFELSSENRRILKKNQNLELIIIQLPDKNYTWKVGKMAKDFYAKFGDNVMSANKIKEMFADPAKSNMNCHIKYTFKRQTVGYCLAYSAQATLHYAYPFYKLQITGYDTRNLGMAMMLKAIYWAKEDNKKYIYLGSDHKYKHQFKGLEVFDGLQWVRK